MSSKQENFIRCSMSSVIKVKVPLLTFSWSLCDKLAYFHTCLWYVSLVHKLLGDCWAHENNVLYTWKQCSLQTMNLWLSIKLLSNSCLVSLALLLGHQTAFASMKCVSLYSDKSSQIGSSTVSELLSTLMSLKILPSLLLHLMIGERPHFVTWLMVEILVCPLNRRTSYDHVGCSKRYYSFYPPLELVWQTCIYFTMVTMCFWYVSLVHKL